MNQILHDMDRELESKRTLLQAFAKPGSRAGVNER
jgi:hypothetical protein